jgi:prepilin-type N-terminal cleavage/methylation domain-containing protein
MRTQRGFTLLELLVVIIIVGVLASVALPSLFRNVKRSEAAEAFNTLGLIKRGMVACAVQYGDFPVPCAPSTAAMFDNIGMTNPSFSAGNASSKFDYNVFCGGLNVNSFNCQIQARDKDDASNTVSLNWTQNGVTRLGTGEFAGIQ